jgi:hypothetical protein
MSEFDKFMEELNKDGIQDTPVSVEGDSEFDQFMKGLEGETTTISPTIPEPREKPSESESIRIQDAIVSASKEHNVPEHVLAGLIRQESSFNPRAKNPDSSAKGLGQLIDSTAKEMGITDPYNIEQNVAGSAKYLRKQYERYGEKDWESAVFAYHHGSLKAHKKGDPKFLNKVMHFSNLYKEAKGLPEIPEPDSLTIEDEEEGTIVISMSKEKPGRTKVKGKGVSLETVKDTATEWTSEITNEVFEYMSNPGEFDIRHLSEGGKAVVRNLLITKPALKTGVSMQAERHRKQRFSEIQSLRAKTEPGFKPEKAITDYTAEIEAGKEEVAKVLAIEWLKRNPDIKRTGWIGDVMEMAPQVAAQILISVGTGGVGGGAFMGSQIMGATYIEAIEGGSSHERALAAGMANAIVQAPLEQIGLGKAAKWLPLRKKLIGKIIGIAGSAGREGITELLQAFPEQAAQIFSQNPDLNALESLDKLLSDPKEVAKLKKNMAQSLSAGMMVGAGTGSVGVGINQLRAKQERIEEEVKIEEEKPKEPKKKKKKKKKAKKVNKELEQIKKSQELAKIQEQKAEAIENEDIVDIDDGEMAKIDEEIAKLKKEIAELEKETEEKPKPKPRKKAPVKKEPKEVTEPPKKKPVKPKEKAIVETPEFKTSKEAIDFGKDATEDQITTMARKAKEAERKSDKLRKQGKLQEAMDAATESQFNNEAVQSAKGTIGKTPTEQKVVPTLEKPSKKAVKKAEKELGIKRAEKVTKFSQLKKLAIIAHDKDGNEVMIDAGELSIDPSPSKGGQFAKEVQEKWKAAKAAAQKAGYKTKGWKPGFDIDGEFMEKRAAGKALRKEIVSKAKIKGKAAREKAGRKYAEKTEALEKKVEEQSKQLKRMRPATDADRALFNVVDKSSGYAANSRVKSAFGKDTFSKEDLESTGNEAIWKWIRKLPKKDVQDFLARGKEGRQQLIGLARNVADFAMANKIHDRIAKWNDTNRNKLMEMVKKGEQITTVQPTDFQAQDAKLEREVAKEEGKEGRPVFTKKKSRMTAKRAKEVREGKIKHLKKGRAARLLKREERKERDAAEKQARLEKARGVKPKPAPSLPGHGAPKPKPIAEIPSINDILKAQEREEIMAQARRKRAGLPRIDDAVRKAIRNIVLKPAKESVDVIPESQLDKKLPIYKDSDAAKADFYNWGGKTKDPKKIKRLYELAEENKGDNWRVLKIGDHHYVGRAKLVPDSTAQEVYVAKLKDNASKQKAIHFAESLSEAVEDETDPMHFLFDYNLKAGVKYIIFDDVNTLKDVEAFNELSKEAQNEFVDWFKNSTGGLHTIHKGKMYNFVNMQKTENPRATAIHESIHSYENLQLARTGRSQQVRIKLHKDLRRIYNKYADQFKAARNKSITEGDDNIKLLWSNFIAQVEGGYFKRKGKRVFVPGNMGELIAYMFSHPEIFRTMDSVMTTEKVDGKPISFWRRLSHAIMKAILPQKKYKSMADKIIDTMEKYLGTGHRQITTTVKPQSIYSLGQVVQKQINQDKKKDEVVKKTIASKKKTPEKSVIAKVAHGAVDWLDIKAPWTRIGAKNTGSVFSRFFSIRSKEQIQGVEEATKIMRLIRAQFGRKVNNELLGETILAYEDPDFFDSLDKDKQNKMRPIIDAYDAFFKWTEAIYKDRGVEFNFKERMLTKIEAKIDESVDPKKRQKLFEDWDILNRTEFVHIPIKTLFKEALKGKLKVKLSKDNRRSVEAAMQVLNAKKRRAVSLTKIVKDKKNNIKLSDINPVEIMMSYMDRFAKDMALLDIRDALVEDGLASKKTDKGKKPKGKKGQKFQFLTKKASKNYSVLKGHWIDERAIDTINNVLTLDERQNVWEKGMAIAKMSAFYNPLFLPVYDIYQSAMSGAWFTGGPWNVPKNLVKAFWHTHKQTIEYKKAMTAGLFSKPFDFPWKNYRAMMKVIKKTGHMKGLQGFIASNAMEFFERSKSPGQLSVVGALYNVSWNTAWKLDETVRMFTYLQLKKRKGWTDIKAAEVAARFHGDYASVPPKTRKFLNHIFFTPTFKIVMGKLYIDMIKGAFKTVTLQGSPKDKQNAMGLVSLVGVTIGFDAWMRSLGWEPDDEAWYNFGRRYKRRIDTTWGPKDMLFTWSNPGNMFQRYAQKIATQDWLDRPANSLYRVFKWEIHPLFRTVGSMLENRAPDSTQIVFDNDKPLTKVRKWITFIGTDTFKIFENINTTRYGYKDVDPLGQRLAKEWMKENGSTLIKAMAMLPVVSVANVYATDPKYIKLERELRRMERQFERDQEQYLLQHGTLNQKWYNEYLERIYDKTKEMMEALE